MNEFLEKDERIKKLYQEVTNHPKHTRRIEMEEVKSGSKGKVTYGKSEVVIEINTALEEESILIFAHELMHYLLVLHGGLLPVKKRERVNEEAESLIYFLMKSLTHHFLLKEKLDSAGFDDLQLRYAMANEIQQMPLSFYHGENFWLLDSYDRSTFANDYNFGSLREQFEFQGLASVFELLHNSPKKKIEDINEISRALIREYQCEEFIELKSLDDYANRKY